MTNLSQKIYKLPEKESKYLPSKYVELWLQNSLPEYGTTIRGGIELETSNV